MRCLPRTLTLSLAADPTGAASILSCPRCEARAPADGVYCGVCGVHLRASAGLDADDRLGDLVGGKYRLVEALTTTAFATLYRGEHVAMGKAVAVKIIASGGPGDDGDRLLEEFQRVATLRSEHSARLLDFGRKADGAVYVVSEYVAGDDLAALVDREGPLAAGRVLEIATQVCASLSDAHDHGIVHGRLKPENVIVSRTHEGGDWAWVLDYGYGRLAGLEGDGALGLASRLHGAAHYTSPEQVTGRSPEARSDLYGVGCLMHWMLTGAPVFTASGAIEVLKRHLATPASAPSSRVHAGTVPVGVDEIVLGCLAKAPADRPDSAASLSADLRRVGSAG